MAYSPLASIDLQAGINTSAPMLSPASQGSLSDGSWNNILSGDGYSRPHRGFTSQGANTGSRKMFPIGKTWGGIKDIGATVGSGNFIEDIGRSRWGLGAGQPHIEGTDVSGFTLSTNLKLSVATAGVYASPVTAGLGQPSAPTVGIVSTSGNMTNSITAKIERRRPSTGARSLASLTSAVIVPQGNRIRVTFPAAETGQTHWRVYLTFQGFGGTGIHYLAPHNGTVTDIPESTVSAGTVDGVARSLEFNVQDGDLIPIEASYDDYAPPAATHMLRLENVMNLAGCYADSSSSPTSTSTGVAIAVSKQNNYESYIPTHLLYLAEQVVDALARPLDDYGYIGCQNAIYAIQYIGDRGDELPPCTITTILADIGIEYPQNWCHFRGRLLIYTAQGNLILMDEQGNFDTDFAAPVTKILKSFTTSETSVSYDPTNDAIVVANGKRILSYSLQAGKWRQVWLPDYSVAGTVTSMVSAKRNLYVSVTNGSSVTAYTYDTPTGTVSPVSIVSNYQSPDGNMTVKDVYEMAVSGETGQTGAKLAACILTNGLQMAFRRVSTAIGDDYVGTSGDNFYPGMVGKRCLLFCNNIVSPGDVLFEGRIVDYASNTSVKLETLAGAVFNPSATFTELLMFVGDFTKVINFDQVHLKNFFPYLTDARSIQTGFWFQGLNGSGNLFTCDLNGEVYASSRAR